MTSFIGWCLYQLSKIHLWRRPRYSTGIHGGVTCGYGRLSYNGYW